MGVLFERWWLDVLVFDIVILGALYIYLRVKYTYWKKRGIPYLESTVPFGNLSNVFTVRKQIGEAFSDIYKRLEGHKYGGIFQLHRPALVLRDTDIIKCFMTKDFAHFHDRGIFLDEEDDPIAAHLFLLSGQKWRNMRAKLTPTFTSGKIKVMFQTILECGLELQEYMKPEALRGETIEIKDIISRYSTDVISSCAFGIQSNSLKDPNVEFRLRGKQILEPSAKLSLGFFLNIMIPSVGGFLKWGRLPRDLSSFFRNMVKDTIEYRETNNITRPDFMQLMIQLKNKGYVDVDKNKEGVIDGINNVDLQTDKVTKLTVDQVAAQAFVFFVAGFETSSTTATFCLYELALNPDIQNRVRQEMDDVLDQHGGQITYDAVHEMEYLDRVVSETLRKYPPVGQLNRECTSDYKIPDSDFVLEKGTQIVVPVLGLHHDPQYYPEPQRFDPERFTVEEKAKRPHYAYLPFGEGPRICIGMRFGLVQTKVALISLLRSYEFRVSAKTAVPLVLDVKQFTLSPKGGMFLQIVNRS